MDKYYKTEGVLTSLAQDVQEGEEKKSVGTTLNRVKNTKI